MISVLLRSIILYTSVLIALRIMGKGEVAQMNSFELVITLLIADVASVPIADNNIPIITGISALFGLVLVQTVISYGCLKSRKLAEFISGKNTTLINNGKIDYKKLEKERITIDELLEQLRIQGFFNLKDIQYAILETDGNLSVVPYPTYKQVPKLEYKHLPISIIIDGNIIHESLTLSNKNVDWVYKTIKDRGFSNIEDILVCVLDEDDNVYIQKKVI